MVIGDLCLGEQQQLLTCHIDTIYPTYHWQVTYRPIKSSERAKDTSWRLTRSSYWYSAYDYRGEEAHYNCTTPPRCTCAVAVSTNVIENSGKSITPDRIVHLAKKPTGIRNITHHLVLAIQVVYMAVISVFISWSTIRCICRDDCTQ